MGSRKPDDNKGKGKAPASSSPPPILESNDPINPIGTTAESPASSTPPPILESNDPINPIGTTAESPASSTPPPILESNDPINPIGTTAESPASSTPSPILESNDPINPIGTTAESPASSTPSPILESNDPINPIGTTAESPASSTPSPILESNDPINPIGTTAESPASSTPPPILESNDPINPIGTTAEFNDTDLTSRQIPMGFHSTIAGPSPSHGSGSSTSGGSSGSFGHTIPRHNQMHLPQAYIQSNQAELGIWFHEVLNLNIPMGNDIFLVGRYHLVEVSHQQLPIVCYGDMSPQSSNDFHTPITHLQGQQSSSGQVRPLIINQIPLVAQHQSVWGTHQTGNYQQHQAQARHVQRPSLIDFLGQGFPTATPQSSNILGRRERENSDPVGSSKRIAIRSPPPSPRPSSHPSPPVVLQGDSSQPGVVQSSRKICMLCKWDLRFTPRQDVTVLPCGHFIHNECLKTILPFKTIPNATGKK